MYEFHHDIFIAKPIEFVFANATCMKGCVSWSSLLVSTEKLDQGPTQVGTRYMHRGKFMGVTTDAVLTVTALEPNRVFAFRADSQLVNETTYTFEAVEGGTRMHSHMVLTPKESMLARIAASVVVGRVHKQHIQDMDTLKDMLEHDVVVQAA